MAERIPITASAACGHWETLLADALDGLLSAADESTFSSHKANCPACAALYEEARRGQEWLAFLTPEPEVPALLLEKILAHTGPGHDAEGRRLAVAGGELAGLPPVWQQTGFMGRMRRLAEPRLMMTAAMAFFSICLTLNLTGVRVDQVRWSNLKPSNLSGLVERRLTMASTPIVRYYDHLRLVYEFETRFREMRRGPQGEGVNGSAQPESQKSTAPSSPGESSQHPSGKEGGLRQDPPQQSVNPTPSELLETSLTVKQGPALSGGPAAVRRERNTPWTA